MAKIRKKAPVVDAMEIARRIGVRRLVKKWGIQKIVTLIGVDKIIALIGEDKVIDRVFRYFDESERTELKRQFHESKKTEN